MNDERLSELLATHAGPAAVDDAFEDRLYSILQREMRPGRSSRPALLLAAALLLAITIIGAVAVGSGLIEPPWVNPSPTPTRMPTSAPVALSAERFARLQVQRTRWLGGVPPRRRGADGGD